MCDNGINKHLFPGRNSERNVKLLQQWPLKQAMSFFVKQKFYEHSLIIFCVADVHTLSVFILLDYNPFVRWLC